MSYLELAIISCIPCFLALETRSKFIQFRGIATGQITAGKGERFGFSVLVDTLWLCPGVRGILDIQRKIVTSTILDPTDTGQHATHGTFDLMGSCLHKVHS